MPTVVGGPDNQDMELASSAQARAIALADSPNSIIGTKSAQRWSASAMSWPPSARSPMRSNARMLNARCRERRSGPHVLQPSFVRRARFRFACAPQEEVARDLGLRLDIEVAELCACARFYEIS